MGAITMTTNSRRKESWMLMKFGMLALLEATTKYHSAACDCEN
jgi:hypothetical protein